MCYCHGAKVQKNSLPFSIIGYTLYNSVFLGFYKQLINKEINRLLKTVVKTFLENFIKLIFKQLKSSAIVLVN